MEPIGDVAARFFKACEAGQGWSECQHYCHPDASFSAQAEPLADVTSVADYAEWMKGLITLMPDGNYDLRAFAVDEARNSVCAYAVFSGTHTGEGGPVPPTGKQVSSDYVYVMEFEGDKIRHMTKIWNAVHAMRQVGWA